MKSKDIYIDNWNHLQEELFRESWDANLLRYRSSFVYRGLSHSSYKLKTSLIRLEGPYKKLEAHLIRNFQKYGHSYTDQTRDSIWNWLAMAQHHRLPTRLLDWTYSPYIALHFVTANIQHFETDGAIWAVNYVEANKYLPKKLRKVIEQEGSNTFTPTMLEKVCSTIPALEALQKEKYVVFLEPPSLDQRIVNQYALFSLMSDAEAMFDSWLKKHPELFFRIIIPAKLKWEIRDKLDQANITERVLFPGLDGLSTWLTRHYSSVEH